MLYPAVPGSTSPLQARGEGARRFMANYLVINTSRVKSRVTIVITGCGTLI